MDEVKRPDVLGYRFSELQWNKMPLWLQKLCALPEDEMKKIEKIYMKVSLPDADGYVTCKVEHLHEPIRRCELLHDGKVKFTAREHAIREMKARVLEADAIWIRSGGVGLSIIEDYFDIDEEKKP